MISTTFSNAVKINGPNNDDAALISLPFSLSKFCFENDILFY